MADLLNIAKITLISAWDLLLGAVLGKTVNYLFSLQQINSLVDPSVRDDLLKSFATTGVLVGLQAFFTILGYYELRMLFPMSFLDTDPIPTLGLFMVYAMFYYQPILWQHVDLLILTIEQWWDGTVGVGGGNKPHT